MHYQDIGVTDILLDLKNPRHTAAVGQREAIAKLLQDGSDKLVRLAADIAKEGLSPIDNLLVVKTGTNTYTALEGNRRIAALKLLLNPGLAGDHPSRKEFEKLAADSIAPGTMRCAVATNRQEAQHWLMVRHTGEQGGIGVVNWNAEATQRFAGTSGTQADRALIVVEAIEETFPGNAELQKKVSEIRRDRLTTFGRLVSDPYVRERLGIEIQGSQLVSHYPATSLEPALEKIASDLSGDVTVTQLKTKEMRRQYIDNIHGDLPPAKDYQSAPQPLKPIGEAPTPVPKSKAPAKKPTGPKPLFDGLRLTNLGTRVSGVLDELKRLDPGAYPNATAALIRVLVELAVSEVHERKKWTPQQDFAKRIRYCLAKVDPTVKDKKYDGVRKGLNDGTSLLAASTMHGYLHNPHFHPTATELRNLAANYTDFLAGLDALV